VAKPMMVVIGENTFEAVKGQFEMRSLGKATLKGKEREVSVYEVMGNQGTADLTPAPGAVPSAL